MLGVRERAIDRTRTGIARVRTGHSPELKYDPVIANLASSPRPRSNRILLFTKQVLYRLSYEGTGLQREESNLHETG